MYRSFFLMLIVALSLGAMGCVMEGSMRERYDGINKLRIRPENGAVAATAKIIVRIPLAVMTMGMIESRYATEREMERFIGKKESDLQMAWGEPSSKIAVPSSDETIFVYTRSLTIGLFGNSYATDNRNEGASSFANPLSSKGFERKSFRIARDTSIIDYTWYNEVH